MALRLAPGGGTELTVLFYVLLLSLLNEIGSLPLGFYGGFVLERRYGLSNERLGGWLRDHAKSFGVSCCWPGSAVSVIYFFIRLSPDAGG